MTVEGQLSLTTELSPQGEERVRGPKSMLSARSFGPPRRSRFSLRRSVPRRS